MTNYLRRLALCGFPILLATAAACGRVETTDRLPAPAMTRPAGQLVDVGGFGLHFRCAGTGRPTVVIETGLGDEMLSWVDVQSALSRQARVCAYDRAGIGWSDADPEASTLARMVRNLITALDRADIQGPYVLVAQGMGGLLARHFAASRPDEVAGMLLVDSAHENQMRHIPNAMVTAPVGPLMRKRLCGMDARLGVIRAAGLVNAYVPILAPENLRPMDPDAIERTRFCATVREEARVFEAAASRSTPPASLGSLPLIVLTAGRGMRGNSDAPAMGLPPDAVVAWDTAWLELQDSLAALSTRGEHRIVDGAGHFVQIDRPDAVVDAIRDVIALAQG